MMAIAVAAYFVYPRLLPDRMLMWETTRIESGRASTPRAVAAAKRQFDRFDVRGKTREEIVRTLGDPARSKSIYNFPLFEADPGVMVYRFDTGLAGWQFDIHFGSDGMATNVVTHTIQ
jgi:hypothetical protein